MSTIQGSIKLEGLGESHLFLSRLAILIRYPISRCEVEEPRFSMKNSRRRRLGNRKKTGPRWGLGLSSVFHLSQPRGCVCADTEGGMT